jgi:predicted regulator of Ras-like GTPase activity (Roadblock/LC7/MglB family)
MTLPHGNWSFQARDLERLDALLRGFLTETKARCALLLDRSGQLLTGAGDTADLDGTSFASLAAADFAASDQLALLLGEREFTSLYHHGEHASMFLVDLTGRAILATLFDGRSTLGMVRLKSRAAAPHFAALFSEIATRAAPPPAEVILGTGWMDDAEDEIDRLFAE